MYPPINCFHPASLPTVRYVVEGAGGFEDRRRGQRFKLTLDCAIERWERDHLRYRHIGNFI